MDLLILKRVIVSNMIFSMEDLKILSPSDYLLAIVRSISNGEGGSRVYTLSISRPIWEQFYGIDSHTDQPSQ